MYDSELNGVFIFQRSILTLPWFLPRTFSATIMNVLYGIEVKESDDPYISRAEVALDGFSAAAVPGSYLVDFFPFLKHVPSWLPGAGFKRQAQMWREVNEDVGEIPFKRIEDEMVYILIHKYILLPRALMT